MRNKCALFVAMLLIVLVNAVFAVNIETPFQKRTQPDGTEILIRSTGDEFLVETFAEDGYRVVYNPKTKAYHYAIFDGNDRFIPSRYLVGIDNPKRLSC